MATLARVAGLSVAAVGRILCEGRPQDGAATERPVTSCAMGQQDEPLRQGAA